jgi:DNA-directed RNA polymerase alpha subunit
MAREANLLRQQNFGRKSLRELNDVLSEFGLKVGMKLPDEQITWAPPVHPYF